ncbi:MAG: alanine racemase [Endozoicomonas sp.]
MGRPANATINLDALRHNYQLAKTLSGNGKIMAVVKADAYSHGATLCASALADIADGFAVACIEEALELREAGIQQPILLLEGFFEPSELRVIEEHHLDTVVHHQQQIDLLKKHALTIGIRAWLKMDSGMGRVGFSPSDYRKAWLALNDLPSINDLVLMSHFACADEPDTRHAQQQLQTFEEYTLGLPGERSFCNSAGLITLPRARGEWNRLGLLLYGVSPFNKPHPIDQQIQPVMELSSALISTKEVPADTSVGYGSVWTANRPTRIGVIAMGYADGYPRHAGNDTPVLVNGHRVPLIGRVSMDMLTVDLTDAPGVQLGDKATLWGNGLPVSEIAMHSDTIPYQLLCNLNRVPVKHIGGTMNASTNCTVDHVLNSTAAH